MLPDRLRVEVILSSEGRYFWTIASFFTAAEYCILISFRFIVEFAVFFEIFKAVVAVSIRVPYSLKSRDFCMWCCVQHDPRANKTTR